VYQALSSAIEAALEQWSIQMDAQGFPPRLDIFKAVGQKLAKQCAEEEGNPKLGSLGPTWLRGFLNRHPAVSARFAANLDRLKSFANNPVPIRDYF
jgi:hypothetical protein